MGTSDPVVQQRASEAADEAGRLAALKRAIPASRMQDYGLAGNDVAVLSALVAGGESWDAAAERLAEEHVSRAVIFANAGALVLSAQEREWAAAAFNIGQLSFNADSPRKAALYARASVELQHAAAYPDNDLQRLALGTDDAGKLYGWEIAVANPIGAVVVIGGLSGWGMSFLTLARALTLRRIAVVLAEGPGQGETRMVSKIYLSRQALPQFGRFVDRARRLSASVALVGNSFGGLIAAHIAAKHPDLVACCVNGSPVELRTPQFPAERDQVGAVFGADGDELARRVADFNFDPAVERIRCPLLILEGGSDPFVPPGVQAGFIGGNGTNALIRTWPDGLHTLYNHAPERNALIGAWLADRFMTRRGHGARV